MLFRAFRAPPLGDPDLRSLARAGTRGLFGSTALGAGVERTWAQRGLMALYNRRGIFGNRHDSPGALEAALSQHFDDVAIEVRGVIALFRARGPRSMPLAVG